MNSRKQSQSNSSSNNNPSQPKRRTNNRNPNQNRSSNRNRLNSRNPRQNRSNRSFRRNRRYGPVFTRRNRLARAQYASNNMNNQRRRRRRFIFRRRTRMNLRLRKIFVGGLHKSINNRIFYNLFRREGRILGWRVFYDRNGYSRGFGVLEFDRPRDAWKTIQKWNGTSYMGYKLRIEYKKNIRRRINRNRNNNRRGFNTNGNRNYGNVINKGFIYSYGNKRNYQNGFRNVNRIVNRYRN